MTRHSIHILLLAGLICTIGCSTAKHFSARPKVKPDLAILEKCDSVIAESIAGHNTPGAVLCIADRDGIIYEKAYGDRMLIPKKEPATTGTVYDLASLSKVFGTTLAAMQLIEQREIHLNDPVRKYLPEFKNWDGEGRKTITVKDLMTHTSGLAAYIPVDSLAVAWGEFKPDSLRRYILTELPRKSEPGTKMKYSCPGFVTLQYIIEEVTGQRLCDYVQENVFDALGLENTRYLPLGEPIDSAYLSRIAPTEVLIPHKTASNQIAPDTRPGTILLGEVHDPLARRFNCGNSGNAGIFSDAEDLALICRAILNEGEVDGRRILKPSTVKKMCKVQDKRIGRALGWDSKSGYAWICGDRLVKDHCICHSGYTGTSAVLDLDLGVAIILLTNNAHPFDKGTVGPARKAVADIVAEAYGLTE